MAQRLPILYNKKPCYDIVFSHSFEDLSQELQDLGVENRKICIYTDSNVEKLYAKQMQELLEPICRKVILFSFPAGEEHKTLDTIKEAYKTLIEAGFDRKDLILALGGGVVGALISFRFPLRCWHSATAASGEKPEWILTAIKIW